MNRFEISKLLQEKLKELPKLKYQTNTRYMGQKNRTDEKDQRNERI